MLTMAAAASTVAALASAVLISWALQDVASGAIFGAVILGASALTFAVTRGRTAARVAATATDWTATRLTLDAMGGAAAICDVNGRLVCANQAWAEKAGGYRAPAELAGTDAEAVDAVARAQQQAWQQGSATVVFAPAEGSGRRVLSIKRMEGKDECCLWLLEERIGSAVRDTARALISGDVGEWFSRAGVSAVITDSEGRIIAANATFRTTIGRDDLVEQEATLTSLLDLDQSGVVRVLDGEGRRDPVRVVELALGGEPHEPRTYLFLLLDETGGDYGRAAGAAESSASIPALLGTLPLGLALTDRDGRFRFMNQAFCRAAGIGEGEEVLYPSDLVMEDEKAMVADAIRKMATGQPTLRDLRIRLKAAPEEPIVLTLARVTGFGLPAVILYLADNSEQEKLERQVAQATKMQAVGQLAGGVAHDFNNILTAIIGYCDLMLLRHGPGDSDFDDITQIKQNANRAANLVRQLLAFSRQQTLRPQVLQISDVVGELSHLLKRLLGERITLTVKHGRSLGAVRADPGQLEQVIVNLAVNARDAMPEGGELSISTFAVSAADARRLGADILPPADYTALKVSDTGAGIPADILANIFEPFFTTKEVGKGTGLGLSTVYGIVKQTGGYIFAESEPGHGASFTIYLPVHAAREGTERPAVPTGSKAQGNELWGVGTILLVEDEATVRAVAERALVRKGYRVVTAANGVEALERLAEEDHIDLLISDVVMPEMDGPTLVAKTREERPDLPIVFMSGYAEEQLRRSISVPGFAFLPKPFSVQQLGEAVRDALARAQEKREREGA
ncbi:hypothetical protein BSL82_05555 [Tardibacter chloracetimidivorans]|uniref:histidine kinase n=2 Tax=Tardibacter chloracetimidivorans TaxID=1921510 RepID=A0A1L3ZT90_9SPHN|nr:hypothetical protein BSL82_05555 [Tardibacter chloracetimidivorans]